MRSVDPIQRDLLARHLSGDVPVIAKKKNVAYSVKKMLNAKTEAAFREQTKFFRLACLKRELLRVDRYMDMLDEIDNRLMQKLAYDNLNIDKLALLSDLVVKGLERSNKMVDQLAELSGEIESLSRVTLTETKTLTIESRSVIRDSTNKILALLKQEQESLSTVQQAALDNVDADTNIEMQLQSTQPYEEGTI